MKTLTKKCLSPAKNRIMKELYGIDMEAEGQYSKLIDEIPVPDIAISMSCNVGCPFIGRPFDDNWGLEDPTGKSDEEFKKVIKFLGENPGACPWDEAKKYFSKSLMSISSEYTLQI